MSHSVRPARIDPTVFVAPGAVVLGDVTLAARASVWFNTVIRGDSAPVVVGEETNLQDNSVVHEDEGLPALIGARVTVGHRAIVHGCVIEDDCLIGMGSVILSGARIGSGSLVGAASLVRERQSIPPGSLVVGSPARVVGAVSDEHRAAIRRGASHYAALARIYMERGLARGADVGGGVTRDRGPMTWREWHELIECLEGGPAWVTARSQGDRETEARDAATDLASLDREMRLPLVDKAVGGAGVTDALAQAAGSRTAGRSDPLREWRVVRADLCARLGALGPEAWVRLVGHPTRGALPLFEWVRDWVDEDFERRRAIAAAGRRS